MIKIRLKCFSQERYALGKNEIIFELENGTSTDDLEKIVSKILKRTLFVSNSLTIIYH